MLKPPPISPRQAQLHTSKAHPLPKIAEGTGTQLPAFKLDTNQPSSRSVSVNIPSATNKSPPPTPEVGDMGTHLGLAPYIYFIAIYIQDFHGKINVQLLELPSSKHGSPHHHYTTPSHHHHHQQQQKNNYKLIIKNGCLVDNVRDFAHFKRDNQKRWNE